MRAVGLKVRVMQLSIETENDGVMTCLIQFNLPSPVWCMCLGLVFEPGPNLIPQYMSTLSPRISVNLQMPYSYFPLQLPTS